MKPLIAYLLHCVAVLYKFHTKLKSLALTGLTIEREIKFEPDKLHRTRFSKIIGWDVCDL